MILRDYQQAAVDAVMADVDRPGNSLVVLPTGAGKSIVIAKIAEMLDRDILVLQPSKEILEQNRTKLAAIAGWDSIGTYSASMNSRTIRRFTFATIGSVYRRPEFFRHFDKVLIDECDLMNPKNTKGMFTRFLAEIGEPKVFGLTATPYRNMTAYLRTKYGGVVSELTLKLINRIKPEFWRRIIYNINNQELFNRGYLCPLRYFDRSAFDHTAIPMNRARTDFDTNAFAHRLETHRPTILELVNRAAAKGRSVLVFCNSVAEAEALARRTPGASAVSGDTPKDERERIIADFRERRVAVVYNMNCLTVGFDHPGLDTIFLLRPTRSLRLYYQMLGRGIRISPGKDSCVVVDFTANVRNLGRIETIRLVQEKRLLDRYPKWYLETETDRDWHGKPLYSMELKKKCQL